jgi:putative transposase
MARKPRNTPCGYVYHVLNRSAGRITLFRNDEDYAAFERVMLEAHQRVPLRILAWCLMKNHWQFVVRPRKDDDLTAFFRWLAHTHAMRLRVARNTVGWGHLYQGRFKAFPVQSGHHVLEVCRYVERSAVAAGAVQQAQQWRWGSLWVRCQHGKMEQAGQLAALLQGDPVKSIGCLSRWVKYVNTAATKPDLQRLAISTVRGRPFGAESWVARTVGHLGLEHTIRSEGRPLKATTAEVIT